MIIGHQKQWRFLKSSILSSRLAHAYLFSGPTSIGKKAIALEFVRLLNCQEKDLENRPCLNCPSCISFLKKVNPDFTFIEPVSPGRDIQIAQMRDLIYRLSLKPFISFYKTGIVDQAHLMNSQAQNCLLKTLEEPKGKTLLVLVTEYPEILFSTVRSRVQEIKFSPVSQEELTNFLTRQNVPQQDLPEIIRMSLGRPGKALEFIKDNTKMQKERAQMAEFSKIMAGDLETRFKYAELLSKRPLKNVLEKWLKYLRQLLLSEDSSNFAQNDIIDTIKQVERLYFLITTRNVNKRLALEALMLQVHYVSRNNQQFKTRT